MKLIAEAVGWFVITLSILGMLNILDFKISATEHGQPMVCPR